MLMIISIVNRLSQHLLFITKYFGVFCAQKPIFFVYPKIKSFIPKQKLTKNV